MIFFCVSSSPRSSAPFASRHYDYEQRLFLVVRHANGVARHANTVNISTETATDLRIFESERFNVSMVSVSVRKNRQSLVWIQMDDENVRANNARSPVAFCLPTLAYIFRFFLFIFFIFNTAVFWSICDFASHV